MSDEISAKVRDIQLRVEAVQRERVRVEQERDKALSVASDVKNALERDFGVHSIEEANELLKSLESEVRAAVVEIEEVLSKLGV